MDARLPRARWFIYLSCVLGRYIHARARASKSKREPRRRNHAHMYMCVCMDSPEARREWKEGSRSAHRVLNEPLLCASLLSLYALTWLYWLTLAHMRAHARNDAAQPRDDRISFPFNIGILREKCSLWVSRSGRYYKARPLQMRFRESSSDALAEVRVI